MYAVYSTFFLFYKFFWDILWKFVKLILILNTDINITVQSFTSIIWLFFLRYQHYCTVLYFYNLTVFIVSSEVYCNMIYWIHIVTCTWVTVNVYQMIFMCLKIKLSVHNFAVYKQKKAANCEYLNKKLGQKLMGDT